MIMRYNNFMPSLFFAIDKVQFDKTHTKSNICFHTFDCASATSFAKHLNIRPKICLQMYIA